MGYRIRVLGIREEQPDLSYLRGALQKSKSRAVLKLETGAPDNWEQLILAHASGPEIALVEYNPVIQGESGAEELEEFISEVDDYQPVSAALWLKEYLPKVRVIYAFQLLSGTDVDDGWDAVRRMQRAIWNKSGGILQADLEGFSNEDGYHILWQFSDRVTGPWNMAVLQRGKWVPFEIELGNPDHRKAFARWPCSPRRSPPLMTCSCSLDDDRDPSLRSGLCAARSPDSLIL